MDLIRLAQQKNLPSHQYMDQSTLNWIIQNKPSFCKKYTKADFMLRKYLQIFIPQKTWFLIAEEINAIHGLRHLLRVAIYTFHLCNSLRSRKGERNLFVSAILHDIRRLDSKKDFGHAKRSAEWFLKNANKLAQFYKISFNKADIEEIYQTIYYHELPYDNILLEPTYQRYKQSIDILKTADALDRYRQPNLKWWMDRREIKLIPSKELDKFAYKLVTTSEGLYLNGLNNIRSVHEALKILQVCD